MVLRFEDFYDWRMASNDQGYRMPEGDDHAMWYEAPTGEVMSYWDFESGSGALVVED